MLFPTTVFAVFFVVVYLGHWLLRPHLTAWKIGMTVASFVFYGWLEWRSCGLLAMSIGVNAGLGTMIGRAMPDGEATAASRNLVRAGVVANLALLAWFKYAGWVVFSLWNPLPFGDAYPSVLEGVVLPLGISFFTFQAISYIVDIGRGELEARSVLDFAVYLSFFAHLVAGPIVRGTEFFPQLNRRNDPRFVHAAPAFRLIAAGMFKKVVVSSFLASQIVDPVFAAPNQHSAWEVLWAILGYAIQIYADFSGYTDIAIGVALLLGFRFPQNFDSPYAAVSLQDFWRRWHMTLSRWLRDYLYIPLGGNRGSERATYRNLMLTMVLGGLWHGAAWTFVIWGAIHGGVLAFERHRSTEPNPWVGRLVTFGVVCVAWVFFRATSPGAAFDMLARLFTGWGPSPHAGESLVHPLVPVVVLGMVAVQYLPSRWARLGQRQFGELHVALQGVALGVSLVVIDSLGPVGVAPFIYFQF